jgi:hypothetical protein
MMGPLMIAESQNKWRLPRLTISTRWCLSLVLLCAAALPAPALSQGTQEQRSACTSDALRLCSEFIPNADEITLCLREKNAELSDDCRTVFEAEMKQSPHASDGTRSRKRTAR